MTNNKKESLLNICLSLAMLLLLVTAFLPLIGISNEWLRYTFAFGAVLAVVVRLLQRMMYRKNKSLGLRVRRLLHLEFWSSLSYLVAAYFLVSDPYHSDWLAFLLIGAVIQIYTSFMVPYADKKDKQNRGENNDK